ncbi:MAG: hypothetical protein U9Q72_01815 [Patescibacteria group bacterium]|nr:hypothetical protein [Patescibacteria group bacterium]
MKKLKKILQSFLLTKSQNWQTNRKKIPLISFSILVVSIFFIAGCSGTLKGVKPNNITSTTPSNSNPSYNYTSYMTRSNHTCSGGRIFLGTDTDKIGDNIYVAGPSVIKEIHNPNDRYRMWYAGYEGSAWRVYHANSTDSNAWRKKNNKVPPEGIGSIYGKGGGGGEYGTDGRIPLSPKGSRDNVHVANPTVLQERVVECIGEVPGAMYGKADYHAWYGGYDEENSTWRIFNVFSISNGLTWNKYSDQAVINTNPNSKANIHVHNPTVVLDINKYCCSCPPEPPCCCEGNRMYHMWYSGYDGSTWRIFYATSMDGEVPWQKHGVVLDVGDEGDCDNIHVSEPTVVLEKKYTPACCGLTCVEESRTYHMWYAGYGGDPDNSSCEPIGWRIFHATSMDGIHWQKEKNPVLNLGPGDKGDNIHIAGPTVISDTFLGLCGESGPPFLMWYAGYDGAGWVIYKAKSSNGTIWNKVNNSTP